MWLVNDLFFSRNFRRNFSKKWRKKIPSEHFSIIFRFTQILRVESFPWGALVQKDDVKLFEKLEGGDIWMMGVLQFFFMCVIMEKFWTRWKIVGKFLFSVTVDREKGIEKNKREREVVSCNEVLIFVLLCTSQTAVFLYI